MDTIGSSRPRTGSSSRHFHLAANGTALVLTVADDGLPRVTHWGAELALADAAALDRLAAAMTPPRATNGIDVLVRPTLIPEGRTGWTGTPGLRGHRSGGDAWSPALRTVDVSEQPADAGGTIVFTATDDVVGLECAVTVHMDQFGVVRFRAALASVCAHPFTLDGLEIAVPVPSRADEVLDQAGRWAKERVPQRRPFTVGSHVREGRHGRTGADAATLLCAGVAGFDFEAGEVWALHVAHSGNHIEAAERTFDGTRLLRGGELLLPGEVILGSGERYESPWVYAVYGKGLDDVAARLHSHLRARPTHPRSPRPVVMNVWEAVYFDHNLEGLLTLADIAASVGVERFVLDDGWFANRRDDTAGLGDWVLDEAVWGGDKFSTLVARVKALGMQFGLWFEPEMINEDSDTARRHPEWLMQVPGRLPPRSRHQQVLDLTHAEAYAHVLGQISTLVSTHGIDFLKWDHNRDLVDAGSTRNGRAAVHEQTLAVYRLLSELRARHPLLEIESCSSGGGRVDLGIVEHTDRVWASDCIDAHERQQIQRWTAQLSPLELIGSHVGDDVAHTTGRRQDLAFRAATALFGHFGLEWDLRRASTEDLAALAAWVDIYKELRPLLHAGRLVRRELEQGCAWLVGAVSEDLAQAVFCVSVVDRPVTWPMGAVLLPGLDPQRTYRVSVVNPEAATDYDERVHPGWWGRALVLSGAALGAAGLQIPALNPDHAIVLKVVEVS
jgi:alpha-galactosidase